MPTLTICDAFIDLSRVLAALGNRASDALWQITSGDEPFWAMGESSGRLDDLVKSGSRISGKALSILAEGVEQVVWGEFRAYDGLATKPSFIVRAIDSTCYEIETSDPSIVKSIEATFEDVRLPPRHR